MSYTWDSQQEGQMAQGERMKVVDLDPEASKFIVAMIGDQMVLRAYAGFEFEYHMDHLSELQKEFPEAKCLGGGEIKLNHYHKSVKVSGQSVSYGKEPDRKETVRLIQEEYPDFLVTEK